MPTTEIANPRPWSGGLNPDPKHSPQGNHMYDNPFHKPVATVMKLQPIRLDIQRIKPYGVFNNMAGVRIMASSDDSACVQGNALLHRMGFNAPGLSTVPLW